jgi:hypothetical protein
MSNVNRDEHRTHALAALSAAGCREGTDWRWADSPIPASTPYILDSPRHVGVYDWIAAADGDPPHPVILVTASAVRKLGGRGTANRMDAGTFPAEMPYATVAYGPDHAN